MTQGMHVVAEQPGIMTESRAHRVFDLLERFAKADPDKRTQFVRYTVDNHDHGEFRFIGNLGFGGKFYSTHGRWYVGCYNEDQTTERAQIIVVLNYLIDQIRTSRR
jgi:hypothetical protein